MAGDGITLKIFTLPRFLSGVKFAQHENMFFLNIRGQLDFVWQHHSSGFGFTVWELVPAGIVRGSM